MQLKDLLISIVIIGLSISLYYIPQSLRGMVNMISMVGNDPTFLFYFINQATNIAFNLLGIVGVIIFFVQKNNIYNKVLKIYLIQYTVSIIFGLPMRLMWMLDSQRSAEVPWYIHLFFAISIATAILAIMVYSKQSIKTLPTPVSSKGVRFSHSFIDNIFLNISILSSAFYFSNSFNAFDESLNIAITFVILLSFPMIYYTVCEAGFKQTIGKVLTGAYVRSEQGTAPGFGKILGRSLCRYIPFEAFSYLSDPMSKWHDKFSGTDVFYKSNIDLDQEVDFISDHLIAEDDFENFRPSE